MTTPTGRARRADEEGVSLPEPVSVLLEAVRSAVHELEAVMAGGRTDVRVLLALEHLRALLDAGEKIERPLQSG